MTPQALQQLLHKEIPISQALGISVSDLSEQSIEVSAPFETNKNIHNTAFAGSIYTTATLAGWSLVHHWLSCQSISGAVVLAQANIRYSKPISGDIIAHCTLPQEDEMTMFIERLTLKKRARLMLMINVIEDEKNKAQLEAEFAVIQQK